MKKISKVLSRNDVSETKSHQAGMYILKNQLEFFPKLGREKENPRVSLDFEDERGQRWAFDFIYYNNKYHKDKEGRNGTRDEYRITPMNDYFSKFGVRAGDTITLEQQSNSIIKIYHQKAGIE